MTNYLFLRKYQELQHTVMYDKLIELGFSRIGYCELDRSTFWNFALTNQILSKEEAAQIEQELEKLDRKSAIYFENSDDLKALSDFLTDKGYKKDYEDSWMFYEGIGYISNVGSLREVRGEGFGKLVTLYCVYTSLQLGNSTHCLATEEGTYPNEFYKRIGFETRFTGVCYTLSL